ISRYVPSDEVLMIDDDGDGRVNVGWQKDGKIFSSSNTYGLIGQQHRQYWQIRYDYVLVMLSVLAQK
ncbi:MAG: hypothetical protein R6V72_18250, partial [Cyclobacterium sp.]|uniref:hypothetical protein n=1 Tax=Cyclobacterium sp. TaxID=1966343 RepID=UPI003970E219